MREIIIVENERQIARFLIDSWQPLIKKALRERGWWSICLSGGRTPVNVYRHIAEDSGAIPWDKAHVFMGDERFVPYRSVRSNFGMVRRTLCKNRRLCGIRIYPIPVKRDPEYSALSYEKELRSHFRIGRNQIPCFDIMVLGIGEDGHTAALFPGDPALEEKARLTKAVDYPFVQNQRITLTFPVINRARRIYFLATGLRKSKIIPRVIKRSKEYPASLVNPKRGRVVFVLDKKAAVFYNG